MPLLPCPFPAPDWHLDPAHFPAVFMVDTSWAVTIHNSPAIEPRSRTTAPLLGSTALNTANPQDNHGEKTLYIINALTRTLPQENITLFSSGRINEFGDNKQQRMNNLPEALISAQALMSPGDLIVINLGADGGSTSFAVDELVGSLLADITDRIGGVVVISAGNNSQKPLDPTLTPNVVVVGGVSVDGTPDSRFGPFITCYGVVPFNLPAYPVAVSFGHSSAATAYTAGMVLMMLAYATSKGRTLTGAEVVRVLRTNGLKTEAGQSVLGDLGALPNWDKLQTAINALVH